MKKIRSDLEEIEYFINDWRPHVPDMSIEAIKKEVGKSYKQFHALLVWGIVIQKNNSEKSNVLVFFTECLSDISHAYFLNLCSLYKSSRSSLRSAVENSMRVILLVKGVDISLLKSVFDLFSQARDCYSSDIEMALNISKLYEIYSDLCESVHSSNPDYLSLSIPFGKLSAFEKPAFSSENERLHAVCFALNKCAFRLWSADLPVAGHCNADMVLDSLPKKLKRQKATDIVNNIGL